MSYRLQRTRSGVPSDSGEIVCRLGGTSVVDQRLSETTSPTPAPRSCRQPLELWPVMYYLRPVLALRDRISCFELALNDHGSHSHVPSPSAFRFELHCARQFSGVPEAGAVALEAQYPWRACSTSGWPGCATDGLRDCAVDLNTHFPGFAAAAADQSCLDDRRRPVLP